MRFATPGSVPFQQRYPESIGALEQARESDPASTCSDLGLGQAYLAQGDYDKALAVPIEEDSAGGPQLFLARFGRCSSRR
jgi:tetratricopeptide (TPR) repeat protein